MQTNDKQFNPNTTLDDPAFQEHLYNLMSALEAGRPVSFVYHNGDNQVCSLSCASSVSDQADLLSINLMVALETLNHPAFVEAGASVENVDAAAKAIAAAGVLVEAIAVDVNNDIPQNRVVH